MKNTHAAPRLGEDASPQFTLSVTGAAMRRLRGEFTWGGRHPMADAAIIERLIHLAYYNLGNMDSLTREPAEMFSVKEKAAL